MRRLWPGLRCALRETTVVLVGSTTNKSILLDVLGRPQFVSGEVDAGWLDRLGAPGTAPPGHGDVALISVAINVYDAEEALERQAFLRSARGGRPRANDAVGRTVELGYQTLTYRLVVAQVAPRRYRLDVGGRLVDVAVDRLSPFESRLVVRWSTLPRRLGVGSRRSPGRGRWRQSPDHAGRDSTCARPGAGSCGVDPRQGRRRCRDRSDRRRARKHEDGDLGAGSALGQGARDPCLRQLPGRRWGAVAAPGSLRSARLSWRTPRRSAFRGRHQSLHPLHQTR